MNEERPTKVALLVGCSKTTNPTLAQLPAKQNIDALACVLKAPTIGDFQVRKLLDRPSGQVSKEIEHFLKREDRKSDELLLLYFSCHGLLDATGQLYFAVSDTDKKWLDSTAISALDVKSWMNHSRSQRIVLLLDCCYGGAFNNGFTRGAANAERILKQQLGGDGRVVITASDELEVAHGSEFTDAVVRGLKTGDADRDGDGQVSVYELYQYVHDEVQQNRPDQTPTMPVGQMSGELYLANNPHPSLPLPNDIDQALKSKTVWMRRGAIDGLHRLLIGDHPPGQKRTARQTLNHLCSNDPDPNIQAAACGASATVPPRTRDTDHRPPHNRLYTVISALGLVVATAVATIIGERIISPGERLPQQPIACAPSDRSADGVLSLGTLLPKSGAFVYSGPALDAAVQLAMKDINNSGGIPRIALKLDAANQRNEGNPADNTASQSTDLLLKNGIDAIIGPATSPVGVKVIDKASCAGAIIFSPGNTSTFFTGNPDRGLYFRTAPPSVLEGSVLGELVVNDRNSTAVVMSRNDAFGNDLREATANAIRKSGGQVLDSFYYDPDAPDHNKDVQRIKIENPDAIILIGFTETGPILAKMIEEGVGPRNKRVYLPGASMTNTLAGQVSPRDPGVLAGVRGTPLDTGGEAFVKRLREASPGLQDLTYAPQAYDAVVVTALAAAVAGTDKAADVANEVNGVTKDGEKCTTFAACMMLVKNHKDIDYDGPSGPLEFTSAGEPCSAIYVVSEIQADGSVKPLRSERIGC